MFGIIDGGANRQSVHRIQEENFSRITKCLVTAIVSFGALYAFEHPVVKNLASWMIVASAVGMGVGLVNIEQINQIIIRRLNNPERYGV